MTELNPHDRALIIGSIFVAAALAADGWWGTCVLIAVAWAAGHAVVTFWRE